MRIAWLALTCCCLAACKSAGQEPASSEITLRGESIAGQIQAKLVGAKGQFHCDSVGKDGVRRPGCFVQLGPSLGDRRFDFSLPDRVVDLSYAGKIVYKVNRI